MKKITLGLLFCLAGSWLGAAHAEPYRYEDGLDPIIHAAAREHGVDPHLVKAVIAKESSFRSAVVSAKGAVGLMQIMPETAKRFGVEGGSRRAVSRKLTDPRTNINAGTRYLGYLAELFPRRPDLVLAAYNAGEGAVRKYQHQIPPYPETRKYVAAVMTRYRALRSGEGDSLGGYRTGIGVKFREI
ncbi:lytic transglycosylase domain-containing protein [Pseudomonas batumici]|uniref:lytic transglycosylase domain-containing protein n=1 Tax=Pseudomonas batumici TaxID=226910 RepID=UPI0030CE8578